MKVAFLHPDLGLGGAERLVVDAAVALVERGHSVDMYTSHYEPDRAFEETKNGQFPVLVRGDFLPRHIAQKGHILFAMLRSIWLALRVALQFHQYDVFFCDQVSICVPILKLLAPRSRVLFYCHFPDMLLAPRKSLAKRIYRVPFDFVEQLTTAASDRVVVNSQFTKGVYKKTFTVVAKEAGVLYPCVALDDLVAISSQPSPAEHGQIIFLSINRFERKKAIDLAVKALVELRSRVPSSVYSKVKLLLAGGYDTRVQENVEYYEEIQAVVIKEQLQDKVEYKRSFSDAEKLTLLSSATALIYTPENEHFGIVPIEAMAAGRPVIAAESGGPTESVAHGTTGLLCEPTPEAFADAMAQLVNDLPAAQTMGTAGRERVSAMFSRDKFGEQLEQHCKELAAEGMPWITLAVLWGIVLFVLALMPFRISVSTA